MEERFEISHLWPAIKVRSVEFWELSLVLSTLINFTNISRLQCLHVIVCTLFSIVCVCLWRPVANQFEYRAKPELEFTFVHLTSFRKFIRTWFCHCDQTFDAECSMWKRKHSVWFRDSSGFLVFLILIWNYARDLVVSEYLLLFFHRRIHVHWYLLNCSSVKLDGEYKNGMIFAQYTVCCHQNITLRLVLPFSYEIYNQLVFSTSIKRKILIHTSYVQEVRD